MSCFLPHAVVNSIVAEAHRGEVTSFDGVMEVARKHLDTVSGQDLAEMVSKMSQQQYKLFDRWFEDQPRYNFAVALRVALSQCIAICYLESK